ncbi:hypothetical protein ASG23_07815 [Cellulomonas sp. Leaf395]|nr:hypothetical protein ASG23_07815 [Cellulomonas sp. Leaf395]
MNKTTPKTIGTSAGNGFPASSNCNAKTLAVDAATMPRGAIQATIARSRRDSTVRTVARPAASGRTPSTRNASRTSVAGRYRTRASRSIRADRTMNSEPIRSIPTWLPNSCSASSRTHGWLASATPRAVVAHRPDSSPTDSATANAASATATPSATWVAAGARPNRTTAKYAAAATRPVRMPTTAVVPSPTPLLCSARWTMLSATVAPIGSMKIPSNARTDSSGCFGRITASSGPTTVGPETMRIAPMTAARLRGRSKTHCASSVVQMPVTTAPVVTSPSTGRRAPPCRREKSSLRDSSNSSSPTAIDTSGNRASPRSASGSTQPRTGPASSPSTSSTMIDGTRAAWPRSCPSTPSRTIAAMPAANPSSMTDIVSGEGPPSRRFVVGYVDGWPDQGPERAQEEAA